MKYVEVYFNDVLKQSLALNTNVISIGRTSTNDLVIDNMGVSSHHALLSKQDDVYFIEDLNSTNGVYVNGKKITAKHRISSHDSIGIGKHTLKLSEWSQTTAVKASSISSDDATVIISKDHIKKISQKNQNDPQEKQFYLMLKGELTGKNKLLLTTKYYGIGKARDNAIRLGGWFTPDSVAEIELIGHSFYITPFKKRMVKLNSQFINDSVQLSPLDEIKIKKMTIKFFTD